MAKRLSLFLSLKTWWATNWASFLQPETSVATPETENKSGDLPLVGVDAAFLLAPPTIKQIITHSKISTFNGSRS